MRGTSSTAAPVRGRSSRRVLRPSVAPASSTISVQPHEPFRNITGPGLGGLAMIVILVGSNASWSSMQHPARSELFHTRFSKYGVNRSISLWLR